MLIDKKYVKIIFITILIFSPFFFSLGGSINNTISGSMAAEDENTISMGNFVNSHLEGGSYILCPDRSYYPITIDYNRNSSVRRVVLAELVTNNIEDDEIDIIMSSNKLKNNFRFYRVDYKIYIENRSIIYDQGKSEIFI